MRLSKAPKTFRLRNAICTDRKPSFFKAVILKMCLRPENFDLRQIFRFRNVFVYKIQCELSCPKSARKVSGLLRNARLISTWSCRFHKQETTQHVVVLCECIFQKQGVMGNSTKYLGVTSRWTSVSSTRK